jgi:peroxiredoxin
MTSLLKSMFISGLPAVAMILAGVALAKAEVMGLPAGLALALANGVVAGFFLRLLALKNRARTATHLHGITAAVGLSGLAGIVLADSINALVVLLAVAPLGGWLVYDFWYSSFGARSNPALDVGEPLPTFDLEDENGEAVSSESFRGAPALFLFFRGNWCPLCMAQIKELARDYRALDERGVQVVLISPQPHGHTRRLATKHAVPFRFLVDPQNTAARQLGLDVKFGIPMGMQALGYASETVMPTVLIADRDGTILFADLTDNYRVRPEPATFLRVLDEASANTAL